MLKNKIIILGGMGPQASLKLHELLIRKAEKYAQGAPDAYPFIVDASMPIPDFIASKEKELQAVHIIQETLDSLATSSAHSICMACNTAHLFTEQLGLKNKPFVSMIKAVTDATKATGVKKVGLLASPNTLHSRLYQEPFTAQGQIIITPSKREIVVLGSIIHTVIEDSSGSEALRVKLTTIANNLVNKGAECIVLGCTELPLVGINVDVPVIDSLEALATKLIGRHYKVKD